MAKRTHGLSRHPLYSVWNQMRQRCLNPEHPMHRWYGARGITVCDRWRNDFLAFMADMAPRPRGLTLERIDNEKGYGPDNCRWATRSEQAQNRAPMGTYLTDAERAEWLRALKARLSIQGSRPHPERRLKPQACAQCGNDFVRISGHVAQRFCSRRCYGAAMERPHKTCAQCATVFKPKRRIERAKFCSLKCSAVHREAARRGK